MAEYITVHNSPLCPIVLLFSLFLGQPEDPCGPEQSRGACVRARSRVTGSMCTSLKRQACMCSSPPGRLPSSSSTSCRARPRCRVRSSTRCSVTCSTRAVDNVPVAHAGGRRDVGRTDAAAVAWRRADSFLSGQDATRRTVQAARLQTLSTRMTKMCVFSAIKLASDAFFSAASLSSP